MSDHDPIEDALRKLRPAELEDSFMARLTATRSQVNSPEKKSAWRELLLRWLLPIGTSAGVAVSTFALLEHHRANVGHGNAPAGTASADAPMPVESQDYLVSARPVGIVVAPNQQPYRIVDVEWLEHDTVRAGAGGSTLHIATTRRDVIPVALEIY
ncbi:MAG: hypothetical protein ABIP20_07985 [Chthoniobacteraceae bacterium]